MANEIYHRSNWGNAVNDIAWGDTYEKFDATNEMFVRSDNYENSNETDKLMAAINPKPSILLTPTAYDNGSLHSVKPVQSFGSELVTNGDFDTASDWSYGSSWSIANGKATATNSTTGSIYQDVLDTSKIYKATFEITEITSGSLRIGIGVNFSNYFTETGTYTHYGQPTTDGLLRINPLSGTNASIDNVSVKEVIDADFDFTRGSSATRVNEQGLIEDVQILSDDLVQNGDFEEIGPEEVTNGDFATDLSGWTTEGTNATNTITWEQGGARIISTDANIRLSQQNVLTIGKAYKLTCNVNVTTGGIGLDGAILVGSTVNLVDGFNEIYFVANSTTFKIKRVISVSNCLLDNVSVKEVGQNWTFGTGWSMGDGVAICDGTQSSNSNLQSSTFDFSGNTKVRLSFDVVDYSAGNLAASITGTGQADLTGINSIGTYSVIAVSSAGSRYVDFTADANFVGSIDNISLIEITDDTDLPRIDYTNGTGSLLLEPQSTNLLPYSEDFSFWSSNEVTTQTGFLAPDGSSNATKVVSTGSNSYIVKSGGVFGNYARTIYARTVSGTGTLQLLSHNTNTNNSFTITENWQRFELNSTTEIASNFYAVDFRGSSTLSEVIIWGAQAEDLSYATSYIPTSGEVNGVTRDADVCNNSGSSDLINSTEGVLYAEIAALANDGTFRIITLSGGDNTNVIKFGYRTTSNAIYYEVRSGDVQQAFQIYTTTDVKQFHKVAVLYQQNNFKLFINGVNVLSDTSGITPVGLNNLSFDIVGGANFYGKVKSVAVFTEALTDEELTALTT